MKSLRTRVKTAIRAMEAVRDDSFLPGMGTDPAQMKQALEYLHDLRDRIDDKQQAHNKVAAARRVAKKDAG